MTDKKPPFRFRKNASAYPFALRERVRDIDYWHRLAPEESEWLQRFLEGTVGNNPQLLTDDVEVIRRTWRENARSRVDAQNIARLGDAADPDAIASGYSDIESVMVEILDRAPLRALLARAKARGVRRERAERRALGLARRKRTLLKRQRVRKEGL